MCIVEEFAIDSKLRIVHLSQKTLHHKTDRDLRVISSRAMGAGMLGVNFRQDMSAGSITCPSMRSVTMIV